MALGRSSAATRSASDIGRPLLARMDSRRRLRSADEEDDDGGAPAEGGGNVSMVRGPAKRVPMGTLAHWRQCRPAFESALGQIVCFAVGQTDPDSKGKLPIARHCVPFLMSLTLRYEKFDVLGHSAPINERSL